MYILFPFIIVQMQKVADEQTKEVNNKLAEIGAQVERNCKQSAETRLALDRVRFEILGAVAKKQVEKSAEPVYFAVFYIFCLNQWAFGIVLIYHWQMNALLIILKWVTECAKNQYIKQ